MPVDRLIIPAPGVRVGFWKITETPQELLQMYNGHPPIENIGDMAEKRQAHFMASRLLAKQFFPEQDIVKDEFGKPHLSASQTHFSWSHSGNYAALIADDHHPTGIDIEEINPRVLRIAQKFCNENDHKCIIPGHQTESHLLIWSAKECLYKLYGKKEVDFKLHMTVEPFSMEREGRFFARFHKGKTNQRFQLEFEIFDHHIAAWVLGQTESASEQHL